MSTWAFLAVASLVLASVPALMTAANLYHYRRLPPLPSASEATRSLPSVSVLIPARDEETAIEASVRAALSASQGVQIEVIVMDDDSQDHTGEIVSRLSAEDPRVRLAQASVGSDHTAAPTGEKSRRRNGDADCLKGDSGGGGTSGGLPAGWCGKQYACWRLAQQARHEVLVWIDADVRLQPGALARLLLFMRDSDAALVSGFPRQETLTWLEKLIVPLIPVVLIGYLPVWRMRRSLSPAYGAGCGQWFAAKREAYFDVGGHSAIRASMHDGVMLPRAFREHGHKTDLFDATDTATCRMYHDAGQVWRGFAKNATEGLASPRAIVPWTLLLGGGFVLPWALLLAWAAGVLRYQPAWVGLAILAACVVSAMHSAVVAWRFRQDVGSAVFRPAGVAALLLVQWYALLNKLRGRPSAWRGRVVGAGSM